MNRADRSDPTGRATGPQTGQQSAPTGPVTDRSDRSAHDDRSASDRHSRTHRKALRRRALLADFTPVNFTRELHATPLRESPADLHQPPTTHPRPAVNFTPSPGQKGTT